MKKEIRLNNDWFYKADYNEEMISSSLNSFEKVNLPHTNIELPYNYFDENLYQFISCYKKIIDLKKEDLNYHIRFEGVMAKCSLYLNNEFIGEHLGGYTPFEFDLTANIQNGKNTLVVLVDSRELENIPPFGGQIDYLTYGGIYREVSLRIYEKTYIKNIKIETNHVLETVKKLDLNLYIFSPIETNECIELHIDGKNVALNRSFSLEINAGLNAYPISIPIENAELWTLDFPNLYTLTLKMNGESYKDRFGFRSCEFKSDGFYLNDEKIQIVGINRHQAYPYVGYAMPKRVQEKDADLIKNHLHMNLVRTSHYPQSKHFLNSCDELGLLVFEEIPGWQHIGDEKWQDIAKENVREMIERDWNHPSIVIWGVRINESADHHEFYTDTNELAHALDTTRQTGGVRCIEKSELLEDVYTMNDFILDGGDLSLRNQKQVTGLSKNVPYLVTEYNGHMYPTKRFDQEERQMEHVNRHLRVQNAAFQDPNISGAIAWCMFDYNTHNDFGSGDRVCYHGIMDTFRIDKFAASVYRSQVSPDVEAILEPVTFWARGERSVGGVLPLYILSNCDYLELQFGDGKIFEINRTDAYEHLPFPPFIIDEKSVPAKHIGEWGMKWEDGKIKGFVDGHMVKEVKLSKNPLPTKLLLEVDDLELSSHEKDATRFVVKVLDQQDRLLPFYDEIIQIKIQGPGKLQGPDQLVLKGGCIGFYIETINQTGMIEVSVSCGKFNETLTLLVR